MQDLVYVCKEVETIYILHLFCDNAVVQHVSILGSTLFLTFINDLMLSVLIC